MKRLTKGMSVVLAFIMLMSMGIYSSAKEQYYRLGDFDLDGEITAGDARMVLRAAVGLETLTDLQKLISDYDGDGDISAADARMVLRTCVGLEPVIYVDAQGERYGYLKEANTYYLLKNEGYFAYTGYEYDNYDAIPEDTWYYHYHDNVWDIEYKPSGDVTGYTPETDPYFYMCPADDIKGCKARIGLYYTRHGEHVDYKDIEEGAWYFIYVSPGYPDYRQKPYSPGNEPEPEDLTHCQYCGKPTYMYDGKHYSCWYGGCSRFLADMNCPECGTFVKANTCHTCKH